MIGGVFAALLAAGLFGMAAILQAVAAQREATTPGLDVLLVLRLLRHPVFAVSVAFSLAGFGLHLLALRSAPLFLVQALISGSVAVTAALVAWRWKIALSSAEVGAVAAMVCGLALVTTAAKASSTPVTTTSQRALLILACGVLAVAGFVAGRLHGAQGAAVLGLLAGVGFAIVAVSGRVLPSLAPVDVVADPATYSLVVGGGLAFLLYSTALQRGAVLTSTSAMILTQTVVPALVGVALLGDAVRSGWWAPALAGFALSVAATLVLVRHDPAVLDSIAAKNA